MSDTATTVRAAQLAKDLAQARQNVAALQKQIRALNARIGQAPPVTRQNMLKERQVLVQRLATAQVRVRELEAQLKAVKRQGVQNALQQQASAAAAAKVAKEERKRRRLQAKLQRQAQQRAGQKASDFVASPPETQASTGIRAVDLVPVYQRWFARVRPVATQIMTNQRVMPRIAVARAFDRLNVPMRFRERMRDELLAALRPLWRPQAFQPSTQSAPPAPPAPSVPSVPTYLPAPPVYVPQPAPPAYYPQAQAPQLPIYMPSAQGVNPYQSGAFNPFPFTSSVQQGGAPGELEHQQYPEELGPDGQPLDAEGGEEDLDMAEETPWWKKPWAIAATVAVGYVGWRYYKKNKKGAPAAAK